MTVYLYLCLFPGEDEGVITMDQKLSLTERLCYSVSYAVIANNP